VFELSEAVQALINRYYPKELPNLVLPEVSIFLDSKKGYKHYDFPNLFGGISQTFEDEKQIREYYWYPYIKEGDMVFDIGADLGSYTLPALARGAYVVSVTPENYEYLLHNINLNGWLLPTRCLPIKGAFYSEPGYLEFVRQQYATKAHYPNMYEVTTLDKMFRDWDQQIDLMKLDVEGAELEVLRGGMELIKRTKPKMLIECHEFKTGGMSNEIMRFIDSLELGYKYKVEDRKSTKFIFVYT
jgi:FkbM family methyltransferase